MSAQPPLDLDWLARFHATQPLQLRPVRVCEGGFIYAQTVNPADEQQTPTDADGFAYVTELIRLARLGQRVEAAAAEAVQQGRARELKTQ